MKLYKYMKYRDDFFEKRLIKFTPVAYFNDPFEGRVKASSLKLDHKIIMIKGDGSDRHDYELTKEDIVRMPMLKGRESHLVGVLSLSESKHSLLMWAHYANSHEGIIVEFETEHPFFNQTIYPDEKYHFKDRYFSSKDSKIDYLLLGKTFPVKYDRIRPDNTITGLETDLSSLFRKSDEWFYEKEYRMLMMLVDGSVKIEEGSRTFSNSSGQNIYSLFEIPCDAITKIIIGCRAEKFNIVNDFKLALEKNANLGHIKLESAEIHPEFYHIEHIPIDLDNFKGFSFLQ